MCTALYLMLCGFLWAFLLVNTRSHNRLFHEPVTMAQLTIQPNRTAELHFADRSMLWKLPTWDSGWYLWITTLPDISGNSAVFLWQILWQSIRE